jgi:hypothetical protein
MLHLINQVKPDIWGFSAETIDDYFPFYSRAFVENTHDIKFDNSYISQIISTKSEEAALDGRGFAKEVYETTDLRVFERITQFIYSC